jgi:hypothetical protein
MEYRVVTAPNADALEMDVSLLMLEGWLVTGGMSSTIKRKSLTSTSRRWRRDYVDSYTEYSQAVVR